MATTTGVTVFFFLFCILGSPSYIEKRGFDYDEADPDHGSSGRRDAVLQIRRGTKDN